MARFFVKWHAVNARMPYDPYNLEFGLEERKKMLGMVQMMKQDPQNNIVDWGCFGNGQDGYLILDNIGEEQVCKTLLPFTPNFEFDEFAVLDIGQALKAVDDAITLVKSLPQT